MRALARLAIVTALLVGLTLLVLALPWWALVPTLLVGATLVRRFDVAQTRAHRARLATLTRPLSNR